MNNRINVFEELMNQRWISKLRNRDLYYQVKDEVGTIRDFVTEKLGYRIISNGNLVKLEKLPGEARPWMGILDFRDPSEYALFCVILMFLEDREAEEQFVLSQLTEYITGYFPEGEMSWTVFANRQKLVRVIKYCIKNDLFLIDDGNAEGFTTDMSSEALYENTGLSKYFMRSFTKDISGYQTVEDFFQSEWLDMNEERGVIRRQRVYRKLLLSLGIYREKDQDEDFNYIKNYRSILENDMEQLLDATLQVYKSSAYLILGENADLGKVFPGRNSLHDFILLLHSEIRDRVEQGIWKLELTERILLPRVLFEQLIREVKERYGSGMVKLYREMTDQDMISVVVEEMENLDLIRRDAIIDEVQIMPIAGRITGFYPKRFTEQFNEEEIDAGK